MAREKTFATWRENINCGNIWREESAFCLASNPDSILRIKQSNISAEEIPENAVRMDAEYSNPDAEHKIYAWLTDDGTMHYWTNADMTRLPDESRFLFSELSNVIEIDLSGIDTSDMKDMSFMFSCCSRLKSLDLSSFDTSKVTDMSDMFSNCYNLTSLDLSRFDTSNVTNMEHMFWNCQELKVLDLSSFDTAKVNGDSLSSVSPCRHAAVLPVTTASRGRERRRSYAVSFGKIESHAALATACCVSSPSAMR